MTSAAATAPWERIEVVADDGTALNVWQAGDPNGTAVVLAHGLSDSGRCWWRVAHSLLAVRPQLRLVMPDARNHGRSGTGTNHGDRLAADLIAVLDHLSIDVAIGVGHSLGARTLAVVAGRHPDRIGRLVLADPPWMAEGESNGDDVNAADAATLRHQAISDWIASLHAADDGQLLSMARAHLPAWPDSESSTWIESSRLVRVEAADLRGAPPWGSVVDDLRCPTLLIVGDQELGGLITSAVTRRAADRNPLVVSHRIDGAGHNMHREHLDRFVAAVDDFLPINSVVPATGIPIDRMRTEP